MTYNVFTGTLNPTHFTSLRRTMAAKRYDLPPLKAVREAISTLSSDQAIPTISADYRQPMTFYSRLSSK